jgi:hypothetical protein
VEDYRPNSHKSKTEQTTERQKLQKVVKGTVKTKKKSELHRMKDVFISEDVSNVKSYLLMDLIIPGVKKILFDIITDGADMVLFGKHGSSRKNTPSSSVSYRSYYDNRDSGRYTDNRPKVKSRYEREDIILDSRGEAEEVLERMGELIDTYGMVTVADLYDLIGKSCEYTDNKYGWTNIRNAEAVRCRDGGYMLKLPKALPIN